MHDEEIGLYYLRSRYYSFDWLRFVNADMLLQHNFNLFTYCTQNPTNRIDPDGAADFCHADWAMMSNRSLLSQYDLRSIAGGYQGDTTGISSSYYAWKNTQAYNTRWINSPYNVGHQTPNHNPMQQSQLMEKMKEVRDKGKAGETAVGYPKNTKHIPSLTGTAAYRVPDILNEYFVGEVKNYSWPVRLTPQIIDEILYADSKGIPFVLFTDAPLAPSLRQLHENNVFILQNIYK